VPPLFGAPSSCPNPNNGAPLLLGCSPLTHKPFLYVEHPSPRNENPLNKSSLLQALQPPQASVPSFLECAPCHMRVPLLLECAYAQENVPFSMDAPSHAIVFPPSSRRQDFTLVCPFPPQECTQVPPNPQPLFSSLPSPHPSLSSEQVNNKYHIFPIPSFSLSLAKP
jgi:hypothetical protein